MKTGNLLFYPVMIILLLTLTSCAWNSGNSRQNKNSQGQHVQHKTSVPSKINGNPNGEKKNPSNPEPVTKTYHANLAAVGDVLIHDSVYRDAKTKDGYDFKPMFTAVKPDLADTDVAVANQESMTGGADLGLSSYPQFNSPLSISDAIQNMGINVVTMANNHTLDHEGKYGDKAIRNAVKHDDAIGLVHTGAFLSQADRQHIRTVTKNGITFSFLAYTYGTNGLPVPKNEPYVVNLIDPAQIKKDVTQAKKISDIVVVSLHFGHEDQLMPDDEQKKMAHIAANAGAGIILGSHPHVLEPAEWITNKNGSKSFVIYSLGNFISGQSRLFERIGGILHLDIVKTVTGKKQTITVKNPRIRLTWCERTKDYRKYHIIPLAEAPSSQLQHEKSVEAGIKKRLTTWMPDLQVTDQLG